MSISLKAPDIRELKPRITVFGVGGAGGNAVNNMIDCGLVGVDFCVANTDAQALLLSRSERRIQMGLQVTEGLGAGSQPEVGRSAAEEVIDEIQDQISSAHMVFITAGMGGGTGTGAAPVIARAAREMGILTVGVVTKPFHFEGQRRMRLAEAGITELQKHVDTLIVIPNQNLFRVANAETTFAEAFAMADQVLYSGVASITDLIVKPGLINLDFADVRAVMRDMGKAMMGTGEATGETRAIQAAEAAIANPLLDETTMKGARGLLISITGGRDMKIYEVDEAANRIRQEVDQDANVIFGATQDSSLDGIIRVSVVATGLDQELINQQNPATPAAQERSLAEMGERLRAQAAAQNRATALQQATSAALAQPVSRPQVLVQAPAQAAVYTRESAPRAQESNYQRYEAPAPVEAEVQHWQETQHEAQKAHEPQPEWRAPVAAPVAQAPVHQVPVQHAPVQHVPAPVYAAQPAPQADPYANQGFLREKRMPSQEELPTPAQQLLRARMQEIANAPAAQRMSLMQRLAAVGIGRREEEAAAASAQSATQQPAAPSASHAEYARRVPVQPRVAQGSLDSQGRTAPAPARSLEDDHLEIPAFLRRQAR